MWTRIYTIEQIQKLKVDDLILNYLKHENEVDKNLTGKEENSYIYKLHTITQHSLIDFEITLNFLPDGYMFGSNNITSMVRSVNTNQLLNGEWWIQLGI
jgi:hypothetical protein